MKLDESIEDFSNWFFHLCYEFLEEDIDWDFFKKKFECLVHISLHGEPEPPNVLASPTFVNHETPLILEEEPTNPCVPCLPPFSILVCVPPCDDVKVGKSQK